MKRLRLAAAAVLLLCAVAVAVPLYRWQAVEEPRTLCLSNMRRLSNALLLYSQDYNGCFPPVQYRVGAREWRPWTSLLDAYTPTHEILQCPSNPTGEARAPSGYPFPCSYALNERFSSLFPEGPYPVENLELPGRTVLLVEAGRFRTGGPFGAPSGRMAMSGYADTGKVPNAYPSPHDRRMNVTAADGHTTTVTVAHYTTAGHDPTYGRLGGSMYNWNGGHPNGETDTPPRE